MSKKERSCNTNCDDQKFKNRTVQYVWSKRIPHVWGENWGYDKFDNIIKLTDYGKHGKKYGWDIDHSNPVSNGGTDHRNNLQPLQSFYNRNVKSNNYPWTQKHHNDHFKGFPSKLKP